MCVAVLLCTHHDGQVGGATALIGDPSGRSTERPLMEVGTMERNAKGIKESLACMFDFEDSATGAVVVNNLDFYSGMSAIHLVRDVGR